MLLDFNVKVSREDNFQPKIANKNVHEISNDNGIRVVNFATPKNLSEVQCSHIIRFINLLGHFLIERLSIKLIIFYRQEMAVKCISYLIVQES
jgi:hypothetical protein